MMLPMMIELGLSRPHERAVLLASLVTGLTFVHTMLDIRSEWPDLDRSAELELISAAVELVLTIETGSDDRSANMRAFAGALLELLGRAVV